MVVRDGTKVHIIPIGKLDYVEAQDDYIALHSEKKSYLKQQTISSIEAQLDPQRFVRIHRSYIVNLERIARIEPYTQGQPRGGADGWHAVAGEPVRAREVEGVAGGERVTRRPATRPP